MKSILNKILQSGIQNRDTFLVKISTCNWKLKRVNQYITALKSNTSKSVHAFKKSELNGLFQRN